jgi:hypothetical protein
MKIINSSDRFFERLLMTDNKLSFYKLNLIGWALVIIADTLIVSPMEIFASLTMFIQNTIAWSLGYPVTMLLRMFYKKFDYKGQSVSNLILIILIGSFITATIIYFIAISVFLISGVGGSSYSFKFYTQLWVIANRMTRFFPMMTTWSLLYFGIKIWIDFTMEREKVIKAESFA